MSGRRAVLAALGGVLLVAAAGAAAPEGGMPEPTVKEVVVETADGLKLHADLYEPGGGGEGKPAVLALHFQGGDRKAWKGAGKILSEHGISLLAPDLRGHGANRAGKAEAEGPAADDPALWKAMAADVEGGLKYLRGTLLADGKKLGIAGAGAGAGLALMAAEKDERVRAVFGVGPEPAACGQAGLAAAVRWNGRPAGLVVGQADEKGEAAPLARELQKHQRTDILVLPMEKKASPGDLLASGLAAADTAQFFVGWLTRPVFTGKKEEGVAHSGGGAIFGAGSSYGSGNCAGSIAFNGYYAPGKITAVTILADPDPSARKLTPSSRRVTVAPGAGKDPALTVTVETWSGTAWKKDKPSTVLDSGTFVADGKTTFYEVWLPPWTLGVAPYSKLAVQSAAVVDGVTKWPDKDRFGGMSGEKARPPFSATNPSSWDTWELR